MLSSSDHYLNSLAALKSFIVNEPYAAWTSVSALEEAYTRVSKTLIADIETLKQQAKGLLEEDKPVRETTDINIDLLRQWHTGKPASLTAITCWAIDEMELDLDPDIYQALLTASLLGEVENNVLYHNNMHFRKVLLQVIRQVAMHNVIFMGTKQALDDEHIALMMLAACIHDLGHDGKGNTVRGVFKQSRLEQHSLDIAAPYLAELGINADEPRGIAIKVMILSTDVTPINHPGNPVGQMKSAYRFHFLGDNEKIESLNLDASLNPLQKDPLLSLMSLLLHEADIATSSGLSYEVTQFETILYRLEICEDQARPRHVLDFLKNICQRQFLSAAGQRLYGANFARIYAQTQAAELSGNDVFGEADECRFITAAEPNRIFAETGTN